MGRRIKIVILQTETFVVYLDEDEVIQWYTDGYSEFNDEFGAIANKISYWESLVNKTFTKADAYDYKCLLAEAYARILDDGNADMANSIIETTVQRIKKHGSELLKQTYILSALGFTLILIASLIACSLFKNVLLSKFITPDGYEILMTSLFGGIGAFVFVIFRLKEYKPEIEISRRIHQIDGFLRIFYGIISGLVICIAIKANIVFGFLKEVPAQTTYFSFFLGIIAGASEVLIPNLVKQMEGEAKS